MNQIMIELDRELFSQAVVARTAHRYSGKYFVAIATGERAWTISVQSKDGSAVDDQLPASFKNDALDDLIRAQVSEQTRGVAEILLQAALSHAVLDRDEVR